MICPKCNGENPTGRPFCIHCGDPLPVPKADERIPGQQHSSEQHAAGGGATSGDIGYMKDSSISSNTTVDSHDHIETHSDSHNVTTTNVNVDSHNVTTTNVNNMHGAPAVSGSQVINVGLGESTTATKIGQKCPICGALAKDDYFMCRACGKDFICNWHMDKTHLICGVCVESKLGMKAADQQDHGVSASTDKSANASSQGKSTEPHQAQYVGPETNRAGIEHNSRDPQPTPKKSPGRTPLLVGVGALITVVFLGYFLLSLPKKEQVNPPPGPVTAGEKKQTTKTAYGPARQGLGKQAEQGFAGVAQPKVPMAEPGTLTQAPMAPLAVEVNVIGQRQLGGNNFEEVVVQNGSTLRSNDNLQVHVRPTRDCYIYVLMFDSRGIASVLFPSRIVGSANRVKGGRIYSIPGGNNWFFLDENTGTETIYVVASLNPMSDLDGILASITKRKRLQEDSQSVLAQVRGLTRGVGGIREGAIRHYKTRDGDDIANVTQIVEGREGSVVWSVSFKHI